MQRSSTRFLILSILVMAILVVMASSLILDFSKNFNNNEVQITEAASSNQFTAGTVASGANLKDGQVPAGYSASGTAISTASGLSDVIRAQGNTGTYKLTADITWNNYAPVRSQDNKYFSGTIDGQGHTITITNSYTSYNNKNRSYWGSLTGGMYGTWINTKFVISTVKVDATEKEKDGVCVGGLFGEVEGTMTNCYVSYQNTNDMLYWTNRSDYDGDNIGFGCIAGNMKGSTLTRVTVDLVNQLYVTTGQQSWTGHNGNVYIGIGAFFGWNSSGTVTMNSCTITGSANIDGKNVKDDKNNSQVYNSGRPKGFYGAVAGLVDGGLSINGLLYDYKGDVKCAEFTTDGNNRYYRRGSIAGTVFGSWSVSNVYYTDHSDCFYTSYASGNYADGGTANRTITGSYSHADSLTSGATKYLGFNYTDATKIWVGAASNYSGSGTSTTGNYVKTVTIGSAVDVSHLAASGVTSAYVPTIAKSNVNGNITAYTTGQYAYLANEASNIQLTYNDATPTVRNLTPTSNAASTTYNAYTATPVVTEKIYRAGSQVSTIDLSSWTYSGSIKDVGTYNMTKTYGSTLWNSNNYYLVSANNFTASVTVAKATLTDASSNYNSTYDGNAHYITNNVTGLLGSDTFADVATIYYSETSSASASSTTPIGITHVAESIKTVYYRMEFDNYNTISGSKTITITPAAVEFNNSYSSVDDYPYSSYAIVSNSNITSQGESFFNTLMQTAQSQPAQPLDYISMISSAEITFIPSSANIQNVGNYSFTISAAGGGGDDADFTIQGAPSFNFSVVQATTTISFTTIGGTSINATATGSNVNESKTYNGQSVIIPTATATLPGGATVPISASVTVSPSTAYANPVQGSNVKNAGAYTAVYTVSGTANYTGFSYTYTYTINKANIIGANASNYSGTYNGSSHNITLNVFDLSFVNGENYTNALSTSGSSASLSASKGGNTIATYSNANVTKTNFNSLAITNCSDSVRTIEYSFTFANYTINGNAIYSGTKTITITPVLVGAVTIGTVTPTHQNGQFYSYTMSGSGISYTYTQIYNGYTTSFPASLSLTHAASGLNTTISRSGPTSISAIGTYINTYTFNNSNYQIYENGEYRNIQVVVNSTIQDKYRVAPDTYASIGTQFGPYAGTGISAWSTIYGNTSGTYYLTSDIHIPASVYEEGTSFSGTIYGNNHTIYLDSGMYENKDSMSSNHSFGTMFGTFSGTLRDVNIVISNAGYSRYNIKNDVHITYGAIAGIVSGATFENVKVTYSNTATDNGKTVLSYMDKDSGSEGTYIGLFAGDCYGVTMNNCTVVLNNTLAVYTYKGGTRDDPYTHLGVLFGRKINSGTATLKNITILGSGNIDSRMNHARKDANTWSTTGLVVGYNGGTINVDGLKIGGWTGSMTNYYEYSKNSGDIGGISGKNAGTLSVSNLYYTPNQGYTNYEARATINSSVSYVASLENSFAFSPELGTASFYVTLPNTYSTTGKYTVSVKNGTTTTNVYNISAPAKAVVYYVLNKANQTGELTINSNGSYGVWTLAPSGSKVYDHTEEAVTLTSNAKASGNTVIQKSNNTTSYSFYPNALASTIVAQSPIGTKTGTQLISFTSRDYSYTSSIINADVYTISILDGYEDSILYEENGLYATFFTSGTGTYTITPKALTIDSSPKSEYYDPRGVTTQTISDWGIVSGLIPGDEANSPVTFTIKNSSSQTISPTAGVYDLNVGSYTVVIAIGGANSNYSVTGGATNVSLTINQVTVQMVLDQNPGFTSNPATYLVHSNAHPNNVAYDGSLVGVNSPNYAASNATQFAFTQTYNSYQTTIGLDGTNKLSYYGYEIPFEVSNNTITDVNPSAHVVSISSNDSNFATIYLNVGVTISKYTLSVTFNDVKELYDSRIDYNTSANAFDFIYVLGDAGIPVSNGTWFTDPWIKSIKYGGLEISSYQDLFGASPDAAQVLSHANASMVITGVSYSNYNSGSAGNYDININVTISGSNLSNFYTTQGTSFSASTFTSTGAASSYYTGDRKVGENVKTNAKVRLKLIAAVEATGSDSSLSDWEHHRTAVVNSNLMQFAMTHYYDTVDYMGNNVSTTYTQATTYRITGDITYDSKMNGAMILPAYKTINGAGYSFNPIWLGGTTNQIEGAIIADSSDSTSYCGNSTAYASYYPANVTLVGGSYTYYGVADFIALSYGTIRNININVISRPNESFNQHYITGLRDNASYGLLVGINLGSIQNATVSINRASTYTLGYANKQMVVGGAVGINAGKIDTLTTYLNSTQTVIDTVDSTSLYGTTNITIGGAVGVNTRTGDLKTIIFENNGALRMGNPVDGQSSSDVASNSEKDRNINAVSMGGLVAINAGGGVHYSIVRGSGSFIINSRYSVTNVITGYNYVGKITSEEYNAQEAGSWYTRSGTEGNYTYTVSNSYDSNAEYYTANRGDTSVNLFNIQYVHLAMGIAISNNADGTTPTYNGFTVYDCVDSNINKVDHIIIDYAGLVQFYAHYYMAGIAFAKAAQNTHVTNNGHRYSAIIWNERYNTDFELYALNAAYAQNSNVSSNSPSSGLSLMGWVDALGVDANFVGATQVVANVTELDYGWQKVAGNYTGNLEIVTSEIGMKPKNPISQIGAYFLPSGSAVREFLNNNTIYTFTQLDVATLIFNLDYMMNTDSIIVNDNQETYKGNAIKLEVKFNYPHVEINDVYQLVQFLWFDSSDIELSDYNHSGTYLNIKNYYLQSYLDNIKMLIFDANSGLKKATRENPFGAWVEMNYTYIDDVLAHYNEDEYYILYYNSSYYYIFLEKYYDEDGDEIPYYSANVATLGSDISLNQYGNAHPDFGFEYTQWQEFPATKSLDGQGHTIELLANKYTTTSYNSSSISTTKWYINNGDSSNANWLSEVWFDDVGNTPSVNQTAFIFGGFVGINRGTIANIHFTYDSILNITALDGNGNPTMGVLEKERHFYVGMISAYSTGVIDGCELELKANSQVYVNKKLSTGQNQNYDAGVFMGGFTGVLGQGAVIKNSTIDMGSNVRFGAQNIGRLTTWGSFGKVWNYIGGFTGFMLGGSQIYNAKIEGDDTSVLFGFTEQKRERYFGFKTGLFERYYSVAGGLVGVNTTDSAWNIWGLGAGTIDGVIFNWKGTSLSGFWNNGWFGSTFAGDRSIMSTYYYGGNIVGICGRKSGNSWVNSGELQNLYYTFELDTFSKVYPGYSNGSYHVEGEKLSLTQNTLFDTQICIATDNGEITNVDKHFGAAVSISDVISNNTTSLLNDVVKVLSIYEIPYTGNATDGMGDSTTNGSGIKIVGGTTTSYNNGKSLVTSGAIGNVTVTKSSLYKVVSTVGDLLSWGGREKDANILCSFNAGADNPSSIMWQITIDNARSETGSFLENPEAGNKAITVIPVYKFAKSLEEAQTYKKINYTIRRGQGDGMALYYCMGDSAVLSPSKTYYKNDVTEDATTYYPTKALMYDGVTSGENTSVNVYDANGDVITRVSSNIDTILSQASESIIRDVYIWDGRAYVAKGENANMTDIGSYKVQFRIHENDINENAYVAANYRVMFFNATGEEALRKYTYEVDEQEHTIVYVKRDNAYYEKVVDPELIEALDGISPIDNIYTYDAIEYDLIKGSYYKHNAEFEAIVDPELISALNGVSPVNDVYTYNAQTYKKVGGIFYKTAPSTSTTIIDTVVEDPAEVETYTIYMVIAPISMSLTKVLKTYDGHTDLNYTYGNNKNYSLVEATLDATFTYSRLSSPTITGSVATGKIMLTASGYTKNVSLVPGGSYDSPEIGSRSATFRLSNSMTYTLYEYDANTQSYYTCNITTYYLDDVTSTSAFFTISDLTTLQSVNDSTHVKTYGYGANITEYTVSDTNTCQVKIVKAGVPTITLNNSIGAFDYSYIGEDIDYLSDVQSLKGYNILHFINVTTAMGETWAADNTTYFAAKDFVIHPTASIKDASGTKYEATFTVQYVGAQFMTTIETLALDVYVHPAALTIQRAVKDYGANDNTTTIVLRGFKGSDTQADLGAISGTFSQSNVGKNLAFTIANTSTLVVNGVSHANTLTYTKSSTTYKNYYISNNGGNIGVIAPIAATIENAYKTFDGTDTVTYSGTNPTHLLIKSAGGDVLDFEPAGSSYENEQVGVCGFTTNLIAFTYVDANGNSQTRYIIKDGSSMTNYYISGATRANYTAPNKASILPKEITIVDVYKEYDGTTTLGTFNISSGLVQGDTLNKFDGAYSSAHVVKSGDTYNDVTLTGAAISLNINNGTAVQSNQTYYVLKAGRNNSNYTLNVTPAYASRSGSNFELAGKGVIIPAEVTINNVTKYYDNTLTFDTNDDDTTSSITYNNETITDFIFTGSMNKKDYGTGYTVTPNTTNFVYGETYLWLYDARNEYNDYRVASASTSNAGTVLQVVIKVDGQTASGSISNIKWGGKTVKHAASNVYTNSASNYEAIYDENTSYTGLSGTLTLAGQTYNITNNQVTVDGQTATFTVTTSNNQAINNAAHNAGVYTYTVSMTGNSNFVLDTENFNNIFYFGIYRKSLSASNVYLIAQSLSKTYDGTATTPSLGTVTATIRVDGTNIVTGRSVSNSTLTASGCVNAGVYTQGSGSGKFKITGSVSFNTDQPTSYSGNIAYNYRLASTTIDTATNNKAYTNANYVGNSSYETKYTINKADLTPITTIEKDFDGATSMEVELAGIGSEKVMATYSYTPSTSGLSILPGTYTGSATVTHNNTNYNAINTQNITLTIHKAKIVVERMFKTTTASVNYFNVAFAITNLKGFNFLTFVNDAYTTEMNTDITTNGIGAEATSIAAFVDTLNTLFVMHINDANDPTAFNLDMLDNINVIEDELGFKTLEITLKGESSLDNVTLTDRYSIYMKGTELVNAAYELSTNVLGSNVATSSSELADGQFDGALTSTGTAIATLADLYTFMSTGTGTGYLTNNIYGYDAIAADANTFSGTLDGNGYTIELTGGFKESGNYLGAFAPINSGIIRNVNFKFISDVELDANSKVVGLVVGQNTGTFENVSLDITRDINIKAETAPTIGGLAGTIGTGASVAHVTINFADNITYADFGGLANTITDGTIAYVTVRNNKSCTAIAGKALVNTTSVAINYIIDAITFTDDLSTSGVLANIYNQGGTALQVNNTYTNGYLDYYFTKATKFTTGVNLHNEYDDNAQTNVNKSHYYGYSQGENGFYVAIEYIAPINRFIWEAFDAYYLSYSTSLNRVVGLYALSNAAQDTPAELVSAAPTTYNTQGATKFRPVIGMIVTTVISDGTATVQEYEYTGSTITAAFEAEGDITLYISGVDVGIYTEYYQEIEEQQSVSGITWDTTTFTAQILTSEEGVGEESIMLIIVPKQLDNAPTIVKEYDSTNIAETQININNTPGADVYAVGSFNNTQVGTGYQVQYNSQTKTAAAFNNGNGYTFVTYNLTGYDTNASKHIYTVKPIYVGENALTSTTNVTSLTKAQFAQAYYQLVTLEEIQALAQDTTHNQIIFANNIGNINNLSSVNVYDLTFAREVDELTHEVTWGNAVYYSATIKNASDNTLNKNYNYLLEGNTFAGSSIYAASSTTTPYIVTANEGAITKRTIPAIYSNLNQSYRGELAPIGIEVASIENLDNLPFSLTEEQMDDLIDALNEELSQGTSFDGDVLASTYEDEENEDADKLVRTGTQGNYAYYAATEEYQTIQLSAMSGTYDVTDNLRVSFSDGATLTLRYFKYLNGKFVIETFDDLLMVDSNEGDNEYQGLDYIVTNNLNGKGQLVTTFINTFEGTIDGNNKVVRNFTLVGSTATGLFGTLANTATISNLAFANVLVVATNTATIGIVATENNGTLTNITIDAFVASDNNVTIQAFGNKAVDNTSVAVIETTKNLTVDTNVASVERPNTVILYRVYGLNGSATLRFANTTNVTENAAKAVLAENRLNTPVTINQEVVQIANFREYWVWVNVFKGILSGSNTTTFMGYQFEI